MTESEDKPTFVKTTLLRGFQGSIPEKEIQMRHVRGYIPSIICSGAGMIFQALPVSLKPGDFFLLQEFLEKSRENLRAWQEKHSVKEYSRSFDLSRGLKSSIYYSNIHSLKAPVVPLALPFQPTSGIRFLARDPFDDSKNPKVLYEEVYAGGDGTADEITLPLSDINMTSREYVRGGPKSTSAPFIPGGESWSEVETSEEEKNMIKDARSLKWLKEYESGLLPEVPIPGFAEYLVALESDQTHEDVKPDDAPTQKIEEDSTKINISNLFDGIIKIDHSDDEESEEEVLPSIPKEKAKEEDPVDTSSEFSAVSIIEQVLEGKIDVASALPRLKDEKASSEEKVWAIREPIRDMDAEWSQVEPYLAKKYPFELDRFQKEAILHMENDKSVFVAAHTSAGKTVAAEYAFALAEKHCTRAVYTSPIKTISNQKFRDFSGQFEVGLLTGDVSIKPDSTCLIMTTEILRSMLYKGADIIRDIEWVIFDEVHYVNDAERGVVWEEVIIMLPDHIKLLLLSATVPNVLEFANWVGKTKQKTVYVTGTNKRPVPLEHQLYYSGKFYSVCSHEKYDQSGWKQAKLDHDKKNAAPKTKSEAKQRLPTGRGGPPKHNAQLPQNQYKNAEMKLKSERSQWGSLIEKFKKKELLPMVAFCFSKKRCDALADSLRSLDLTSNREKSEIHVFCDKAFSRLTSEDRHLPQILRIKEMLKRGLGIHHAGLLPIVKEVVEMLFCRGVIKVLFATETFAMGVNAPARAVVFQSTRKHDGRDFRNLLPGEYTQMAGRAGRRGLDSVGTVVIACWDAIMPELELKKMLTGSATRLESQFRLTYSMILNLLRVEDLKVEDMLRRSFAEFHAQRSAPEDRAAIELGQKALQKMYDMPWPTSPSMLTKEEVEEYVDLSMNIERITEILQEDVMTSRGASSALVNGRIVLLGRKEASLTDIGVIVKGGADGKSKKKKVLLNDSASEVEGGTRVVLKIMRKSPLDPKVSEKLNTTSQAKKDEFSGMKPLSKTSDDFFGGMKLKTVSKKSDDLDSMFGGMKLAGKTSVDTNPAVPLPHTGSIGSISFVMQEEDVRNIVAISKSKIEMDGNAILSGNSGKIGIVVQGMQEIDAADLDFMDPISDLKVSRIDLVALIRERQMYIEMMMKFRGHRDPLLPELVAQVKSEKVLMSRLKQLVDRTGEAGLSQMPEFLQRVKLLQKMGYTRSDKTVTMKGRVACEINSGSELVGTEIIFGGLLSNLSPQMAVALLSALVFQDKTDYNFLEDIPSKLMEAYERASALAWHAGEEQASFGLNIAPDEYVKETLNFGLMSVVYHWACGMSFSDICSLTDVMEGSIVRCIVRLDETCREFRDAARVMGDMELYKQMYQASESIKRDIVFAASLYIV